MTLPPKTRRHDGDLAKALRIPEVCTDAVFVGAILRQGGVTVEPRLPAHVVRWFDLLAEELAIVLWDTADVSVPDRIKLAQRTLTEGLDWSAAPGVLWALAPYTQLPRGSIVELHRASCALVGRALPGLLTRIFDTWEEAGIITNVGGRYQPGPGLAVKVRRPA